MTNKKLTESYNFLFQLETTVRCMKLDLNYFYNKCAKLYSLVADLATLRSSMLG